MELVRTLVFGCSVPRRVLLNERVNYNVWVNSLNNICFDVKSMQMSFEACVRDAVLVLIFQYYYTHVCLTRLI